MVNHCPECQGEFRESVTRCPDCDLALVPGPPEEESEVDHPDPRLELVYRTGDPGMVSVVESILDGAQIQYLAKGEGVQDFIGLGRIGGGENLVTGPVEFYVAGEDANAARQMLSEEAQIATVDELAEELDD